MPSGSQAMFTGNSYPREPIHTTPTIEHAPQILQDFENAPFSVAYTDGQWYPVPPVGTTTPEPMSPYQHVLHLEVETLFGTPNHAVVSMLVPPVCSTIPFAV